MSTQVRSRPFSALHASHTLPSAPTQGRLSRQHSQHARTPGPLHWLWLSPGNHAHRHCMTFSLPQLFQVFSQMSPFQEAPLPAAPAPAPAVSPSLPSVPPFLGPAPLKTFTSSPLFTASSFRLGGQGFLSPVAIYGPEQASMFRTDETPGHQILQSLPPRPFVGFLGRKQPLP